MKEAAISYSPHAYVPKRTLTEEERVELYRTRIDASFKPYTVIDVLQKVYHRSFEDDLLNAVTLHPEWFQPSVDGWKLARAWIRSLRIIRPESIFFQKTSDFQVDIALEARICMEQARCGNALLKRRCNADKTLRLRYSFDLRPCKMSCSYLGAVMNEKDSLRERDFMGISVDKYLIPVLKPGDYSMIARYIFSRFLPEQLNSVLPFEPEKWIRPMGLKVKRGVFPENGALGEYFFSFGTAETIDEETGEIVQSDINPGTILLNRDIPDHGGIRNSTLAHEASHSFLGRFFFLLQKTHGHDYCSYMCKRYDHEEREKWTPVDIMEMQANRLPGYLMIQDEPGKAYAESRMAAYGGVRNLANMRRLIDDVAEHFQTTKTMARTRLVDLGYNEARGILRSANGELVPSYLSTLSENETYTISEAEGIREYLSNLKFRAALNTGAYLYADAHYCRNDPKYLFSDQFGRRHLTAYAREHMAECCLVFREVHRNAAVRLVNGILQKGCGRGRKDVAYVGPNGESPLTEEGKALRARMARELAETAVISKSFNQMTMELMERKKMTVAELASATGLSEQAIGNMRNDANRVFPIQGIVAVCIALHLSPETSRAYIEASPSKFMNTVEMKMYQYALAQWYESPVSVVNRRLVEAGVKPLTNLVDGYGEDGIRLA